MAITRKQFLFGSAAAGAAVAIHPARAARRTVVKCGLDLTSDHPTTLNLVAAAKKVREATNGDVEVQIFPNSQLGDDTHMLSNLRSGAIQMMAIGDNILSTLVPTAAIDNVGFAFKSSEMAFKALDGAVGEIVRADIEKTGLHSMTPHLGRRLPRGYVQRRSRSTRRTTCTASRSACPPSPISLSLFQALGASPITVNASELYTALQTHVADGQENPAGQHFETMKLDQVQKYCSLTNHMWVGYWLLTNGIVLVSRCLLTTRRSWATRSTPRRTRAARRQPEARRLAGRDTGEEAEHGLCIKPDTTAFQKALTQAGFYKHLAGQVRRAALVSTRERTPGRSPRAPTVPGVYRSRGVLPVLDRVCRDGNCEGVGGHTRFAIEIVVILFAGVVVALRFSSTRWSGWRSWRAILFLWLVSLGAVIALSDVASTCA